MIETNLTAQKIKDFRARTEMRFVTENRIADVIEMRRRHPVHQQTVLELARIAEHARPTDDHASAMAAATGLAIDFNPWRSTKRLIAVAKHGPGVWLCILGISWFFAVGAVMTGGGRATMGVCEAGGEARALRAAEAMAAAAWSSVEPTSLMSRRPRSCGDLVVVLPL